MTLNCTDRPMRQSSYTVGELHIHAKAKLYKETHAEFTHCVWAALCSDGAVSGLQLQAVSAPCTCALFAESSIVHTSSA